MTLTYIHTLRAIGPSTARELADYLDRPVDSVRIYMSRHPEQFRITAWRPSPRRTAVWYLTNGHPNAEPPANRTGAQRQAAYRERWGLALAVKRRSKPASPWSAFL